MIKTAIIISGAMRTFDKCLPNLEWMVFRHFPEARFYVATHDDADAAKASLLLPKHPDTIIRRLTQPEMILPPGCPAQWTPGQYYMHEPYFISVHPSAVLGQLWMLREGWRLYEEATEPAECVIRCRPDLWFHSFTGIPNDETYWIVSPRSSFVPRWGSFGGCNDRFAILGRESARFYFTTFSLIPSLLEQGCPLHPESLIKAALEYGGAHIAHTLCAEFSTLRKDGSMRPPEITGVELLPR
jgi:hypothetical protein